MISRAEEQYTRVKNLNKASKYSFRLQLSKLFSCENFKNFHWMGNKISNIRGVPGGVDPSGQEVEEDPENISRHLQTALASII